MALVPPDSPLRIRVDIDARQATQLDSIAFSANVVDFLYGRLAKFLLSVGMTRPITAEGVLADAWAIVDWVHRLDGLVRHLRGVRKGSVVVEDFLNATSLVETQRHRIQHLEGTIPAIEATGRSAFGHLCWTLDGGPTDDGVAPRADRLDRAGRAAKPSEAQAVAEGRVGRRRSWMDRSGTPRHRLGDLATD
jgi:hypothetical protein